MKPITKNKLLIYIQDIGGGQFLLPLIDKLIKAGHPMAQTLIHPLSWDFYQRMGVEGVKLREIFPANLAVTQKDFRDYLQQNKFTHVLCSTSSLKRDLSNAHLIAAAKELQIPTLGALDHWKGFDRFSVSGLPLYMPDFLLCIDEKSKLLLQKQGHACEKTHAVGHPYLEWVYDQFQLKNMINARPRVNRHAYRILLVSQPLVNDPDFHSVFQIPYQGKTIIEHIQDAIKIMGQEIASDIELIYRPHPKEAPFDETELRIDRSQFWEDVVEKYDLFVGLDSMALIHAALIGKKVLTLEWVAPLISLNDSSIPFRFSELIKEPGEIASKIRKILTAQEETPAGLHHYFSHSLQKSFAVVQNFLHQI